MSRAVVINRDWRFYLGDEPNADFMGFNDAAWREVNLPHDWSVEHPFDRKHASGTGYLPGGTAWYRKHLALPGDVKGKRVRLTFGGVYKHARVWFNSYYLGSRAYGYSTFTYDVSAYVRPGENVICVRVEHEEVADSRWFTGSGIYRDVTMEISDPCSFETDGIFVSTERADETGAVVKVCYETAGAEGVRFEVLDGRGRAVASGTGEGAQGTVSIPVSAPRLWSVDDPALYTLRAQALLDGEVKDEKDVRFGIRTFRFDCDKGFFLNGVNMKLKGVCVHHDGGCLGAAVPREVWARRLAKFRAAGCNALRTAHNPPDPLLLDLCDEMGLLVMDEAFDEWEGAKNKWWQGHNVYPPKRFGYAEDFPLWHRADLEGMVKRDRNHPCVILWSIGNEIDYPNDPYVTPLFREVLGNNDANKPAAERMYDDRKPDASRLAVLARELTEIVHQTDATRPVISAMSFPELSTRTGYADALDVSGYNYKEQFYEEDHARFPDRVILGSENGHHPGAWYAVTRHDYISGQFLWAGIDFLGECIGWPVRISQAGMLDLAGHEKPLYYQRAAMWNDEPMAMIAAGGDSVWMQRLAWVGHEGEEQTVSVYGNVPEVELKLNGRTLGKQAVKHYCASWKVPFEAGTLEAVWQTPCENEFGETELVEESVCLTTPGDAARLTMFSEGDAELPADGRSVWQVEVLLTDEEGELAAGHDERVHYQLLGDAELLGIENGIPDDLTPYAEPYRRTKDGQAIVYLRAGTHPGEVRLHAWTDSGLTAELALRQK